MSPSGILFFHFIGYTSNQKELPESGQLQHKSLYYIVHNIPPGYLPFMEIEIKITVCAKSCIHISNTEDKYTKKFFMTIVFSRILLFFLFYSMVFIPL